ncbi:hypothetical protein FS837_011002 [Tulasnella sp. UAMH 9824]|nr:hypothetical protein FS837_011002 [Tulasnella sp. UAMH 9824]
MYASLTTAVLLVLGSLAGSLALPLERLPPSNLRSRDVDVPTLSSFIPIDEPLLQLIRTRARDVSLKSWELGTLAEAYLEIDWPQMSVFGAVGVPPARNVGGTDNPNNISTVLELANYAIAIRPVGSVTLFEDGSVGDPASLGVAMLMANWTKASRPDEAHNDYDTPVRQQLGYVLNTAPKTADGAISHRSEQVQLWSDFIYMTPPFIAYYGALYQPYVHQWLVYTSYDQIRLYRNYLFDSNVGLWKHIALGSFTDDGHWSTVGMQTGNGWAAAGMLRVLATMNQTTLGYQPQFLAAQRDLQNWATEIVNNIWAYQQPDGSLLNYATDPTTFSDSASTALLASVTFRLAALPSYLRGPPANATVDPTLNPHPMIDMATLPTLTPLKPESLQAAHLARDCIKRRLNTTDGWLAQVVDPYSFSKQQADGKSPEAESFVLMMEAAWRGWKDYILQEANNER